jgi:asparagine synthase (glutamine-hydrolysing)
MCSINGIVVFGHKTTEDLAVKLNMMQQATSHRGPDDSETIIVDRAALGANRLAIVAPQLRSTVQISEDGGLLAVFNGEIVNHVALRGMIKNAPDIDKGDSAVILPLAEQYGGAYVPQLAGMFAIALYDRANHTLYLSRDPLGIKPLYYVYSADRVMFSSEAKALCAVMDVFPEVDFSSIDDCLKYRFHPGRETAFPSIHRVLPGETITFRSDGKTHDQYWMLRPNVRAIDASDQHKKVDECREILMHVVRENTRADVKGGFFVSGGLDSSLITAMGLRERSSYRQPISLKFLPHAVQDEPFAELLERHLGTSFEWVEISDEIARKTLEEAVRFMDEPLENPIHIGTYLMAKRAQELGIKSVLTGDGSDEFFVGYDRHKPWFDVGADPSVQYPPYLWTMTPEAASQLYTEEAKSEIRPMIGYIGERIEPFSDVDQALTFERFDRLTEYHCNRLDRMTMARGVEARVPFLDHRVIEFALEIPNANHMGATGKAFLQAVAKPFLPPEIIDRPKIHFPSLTDQWTSGEGAIWASEILLADDALTRRWIKRDVLARYIQDHDKKQQRHGRLIWALVTLELWLRKLPSLKWHKQNRGCRPAIVKSCSLGQSPGSSA